MHDTPYSPEKKYTSHCFHLENIRTFLNSFLQKDPEYASGYVHSYYFDTPDLTALYEKLDGDYQKRKIRFRWYTSSMTPPESQTSIAGFLEMKYKSGSGRKKYRNSLTLDSRILYSPAELLTFFSPFIQKILLTHEVDPCHQILPVIWIRYHRLRYICPFSGARIALDHDISSIPVLNTFLPQTFHPPLETIVLEIKDGHLADVPWLQRLETFGFRYGNFSKYGTCLSLSKGVIQ